MTVRTCCVTLACAILGLGAGACDDDDDGAEPQEAPFSFVFEELEAALISVAGTSHDDVWTVGADSRDGKGALILHYDGEHFTRHVTGVEADLWWVHVLSEDSVYMGGSEGTVLHFDGERVAPMETPPSSSTVFGIWGLSD